MARPRTRCSASIFSRTYRRAAPTSPALANLCAYCGLDCRLAAFARSVGGHYTRYADDLAFSGGVELVRSAQRFHVHVASIALEEGFAVHMRKTRIMRQGVRQQLAGVVVNQTNIRRNEYDSLRATLFNCARHGAESQNREGLLDFRHLAGRIAYVTQIHPQRGRRLLEIFSRIVW